VRNLLAYIPHSSDNGDGVRSAISQAGLLSGLEELDTISKLEEKLRKPLGERYSVLLMPQDQNDLDLLISLQKLFESLPVIIHLPDSTKESISKGHELRPRYMIFPGDDLSDFSLVLRRLAS